MLAGEIGTEVAPTRQRSIHKQLLRGHIVPDKRLLESSLADLKTEFSRGIEFEFRDDFERVTGQNSMRSAQRFELGRRF